jgi:hypothetical protein
MNLKKKLERYLRVNLLGPGPSSYKKIIYRAAVSQRLGNNALDHTHTHTETRHKEKTQLYKRKYNMEGAASECDMSVPVTDWPHPARTAHIMETNDSISYATEIFTDSSKIASNTVARVAINTDKTLVRQCKYEAT